MTVVPIVTMTTQLPSAATESQQCPIVTTQRQKRCCRGRICARQRRHARDEAPVSIVAMEASHVALMG